MRYLILLALFLGGCATYTTTEYIPEEKKVVVTEMQQILFYFKPHLYICDMTDDGVRNCKESTALEMGIKKPRKNKASIKAPGSP